MSNYETDLDHLYKTDPVRAGRTEFLRLVHKEDPQLFERFKTGEMGPDWDWARHEASNWDRRLRVSHVELIIFSEEEERARKLANWPRPDNSRNVKQGRSRYKGLEKLDFLCLLRQLQAKKRREIAAEFTDGQVRYVDRHLRRAKDRLGM